MEVNFRDSHLMNPQEESKDHCGTCTNFQSYAEIYEDPEEDTECGECDIVGMASIYHVCNKH